MRHIVEPTRCRSHNKKTADCGLPYLTACRRRHGAPETSRFYIANAQQDLSGPTGIAALVTLIHKIRNYNHGEPDFKRPCEVIESEFITLTRKFQVNVKAAVRLG
jgi:hypothetical protein